MCIDCGCGTDEVTVDGKKIILAHKHEHPHAHAHEHKHSHDHIHDGHNHSHQHTHTHEHMHDVHQHHHEHLHDAGDAHEHTHDINKHNHHSHEEHGKSTRMIQIEQDVLAKNDLYARQNAEKFKAKGIFALNFVSSPGAGKTTLLVKTIEALKQDENINLAVIEGDQQTDNDAKRIRETGAVAVQINTGKGCHLDAHMVGHAFDELNLSNNSLLLIENVGNLVCPAAFDLGEDHKIVIFSVTEGEDKPLKYPDMFRAADLMLINKTDLLPHLDFNLEKAVINAKRVNHKIQIIQVSAKTTEGFSEWLKWLKFSVKAKNI